MLSILLSTVLSTALSINTAQAASNSENIKAAIESQKSCQNFVGVDSENIYLGFGSTSNASESILRVVPIENPQSAFEFSTGAGAIDSIKRGSSIFVLTTKDLEEWNLESKKRVSTLPLQTPRGMARYKNKMIVVQGSNGISIFDLNLKKVTNQFGLDYKPLVSYSTAVAVAGSLAYVVMDSDSPVGWLKVPFRGVVVIDMVSEKVVAELTGLNPGADSIAADENQLMIGFMGSLFWKYVTPQLKGHKLPNPQMRMWNFPESGQWVGHGVMDDKYYYTCFRDQSHILAPRALDRNLWKLN